MSVTTHILPQPAEELAYPAAPAVLVEWSCGRQWRLVECPYCGRQHSHGAGRLDEDPYTFLGHRGSHCTGRELAIARRGYVLVDSGLSKVPAPRPTAVVWLSSTGYELRRRPPSDGPGRLLVRFPAPLTIREAVVQARFHAQRQGCRLAPYMRFVLTDREFTACVRADRSVQRLPHGMRIDRPFGEQLREALGEYL